MARFNLIPTLTSHMRDLMKVSLGMSLVGALTVFSGQAAKFVIGRVLGADALGVFSRANRVLESPMELLGSAHVLFPVMAEMNDDRRRLARGYLRSIALCSLAASPLTVLIWHASEGLVLLLLGQRWVAAVEPTAILSFTLVFGLGTRVAMAVLMALGSVRDLVVRQVVFAALIVTGSVVGSRWGIESICVGVVVTSFICYVLGIHLVNRHLDMGWRAFANANRPAVLLALPVLGVLVIGKIYVWHDVQVVLLFPIEAAMSGLVGLCRVHRQTGVVYRPRRYLAAQRVTPPCPRTPAISDPTWFGMIERNRSMLHRSGGSTGAARARSPRRSSRTDRR